ncbi:septation protein A [Thalassotalea agarivorans]|uniref:Inner membrane-spanning protein YciB n=1 Tax=Thalassotalea agarivorans TaxID=349064 RepID=A0A1I0HA39_THASX|nr:septation protein A [Thalassotalea agarivorans]SET80672.1 intracellular septation protein [Thalassotalea agarivorans]
MEALLEFLPLIIFFVVYKFVDIYWATAALIVCSALQVLYFVVRKQPVPKKHLVLFGLMAGFGGLTIFLQNDLFLKWKVTIVYLLFAAALLIYDKVLNQNLLKKILEEAFDAPQQVWRKLNYAWVGYFLFFAGSNIYVAYNFDQETWVQYKVFGLTILMFVGLIFTIVNLYKYIRPEEESSENKE